MHKNNLLGTIIIEKISYFSLFLYNRGNQKKILFGNRFSGILIDYRLKQICHTYIEKNIEREHKNDNINMKYYKLFNNKIGR